MPSRAHSPAGDPLPGQRPTVRQVECAVAVAEHLHFRKAAESLQLSQPALSAQVQHLEQLLGTALFERSRRGVLPTAAGREVAARGRAILEALDGLADSVRHAREPLTGPLRLGVIPTIAPYLLPRVLPRLRERHPDLKLHLREEFTHLLLERLASGELDCALLALPVQGDFASQTLFHDAFLLAVPKRHELAGRKSVAERDLDGQEVLLLEDGHCLREQALAVCGRAGARESSSLRATSLGTLSQMVAGGLGVTLLPELAVPVETARGALATVPFDDPAPEREVGLVWRRASPRGDEFRLLGESIVECLDA